MNFQDSTVSLDEVILREHRNEEQIQYLLSEDGNLTPQSKKHERRSVLRPWFVRIQNFFSEIFLPQGYPSSVSTDYMDYQIWDTAQAFCSTIVGTLTTHAILQGIGVGKEEADALAATTTWILKDGTGMISKITFAWWKGFILDTECKKWRMAADFINDVALCTELLLGLVMFQHLSSYLLCLSMIMKAIVGVAGGATRAAITQHQAVRGNLGDVSAKDGSQEMCVTLVGSIIALHILKRIEKDLRAIWLIYAVSAVLHVYSNYKAVTCLNLRTLNTARFLLLLNSFLAYNKIDGVREVNEKESVVLGFGITDRKFCKKQIHLGCSFKDVLKRNLINPESLQKAKNFYRSFPYIIIEDKSDLYVILKENINDKEILMSFFHSVITGIISSSIGRSSEIAKINHGNEIKKLIDACRVVNYPAIYINEFVIRKWDHFVQEASSQGWNFDRHQLSVNEWRFKWT